MRRTASEKMEIIRLVEQTDLPVRATLRQLGVPQSTFYSGYQRYQLEGFNGLHDQKPPAQPRWNALPKAGQDEVLDHALKRTDLSPRELACHYTDEERYFVSESSVYRILKKADLITSPAYVLMAASDTFQHPTTRVHEMWQTDFTYFRIINWGWYYLSTVLDDYSRYIIAWKLSSTMGASDVTETLDRALAVTGGPGPGEAPSPAPERQRSGLRVERAPGVSRRAKHAPHAGRSVPPADAGQDRVVSPIDEERGQAPALLLPRGAGGGDRGLRRLLQQGAVPRVARQRDACRCLLRPTARGADRKIEDQTKDDGTKEEGVPGQQGRLGRERKPSLSRKHLWSKMFRRRTAGIARVPYIDPVDQDRRGRRAQHTDQSNAGQRQKQLPHDAIPPSPGFPIDREA